MLGRYCKCGDRKSMEYSGRQDSTVVRNKGSEVMLPVFECLFCQLTFLPYTRLSQVQNRDYNSTTQDSLRNNSDNEYREPNTMHGTLSSYFCMKDT